MATLASTIPFAVVRVMGRKARPVRKVNVAMLLCGNLCQYATLGIKVANHIVVVLPLKGAMAGQCGSQLRTGSGIAYLGKYRQYCTKRHLVVYRTGRVGIALY